MAAEHKGKDGKDPKEIEITIDRDEFEVRASHLTGAQLRQLPKPPIGPDRDLFLELPGAAEDPRIADNEDVVLKDDMHFYTGPSKINPG